MKRNIEPVIVVMLRQPRMSVPTEMRSDPFWEFGSFGTTGCHCRNLMHPGRADEIIGSRLAFAQGGHLGFRLVYLTPPITVEKYPDRTEAKWDSPAMPFRYEAAPVIIDSDGQSDIPKLVDVFRDVNRSGWPARFASKFRSRRLALPIPVAAQLVAVYNRRLKDVQRDESALATTYEQALPVKPPVVDRKRRQTYRGLVRTARTA